MIVMEELLRGEKFDLLPKEHQDNLIDLLERVNIVRREYARPMVVTSGYRLREDHLRIYVEKGITDLSKIPMQSKHLFGQAVDIADREGALKIWVLDHLERIKQIGLWCEDFRYTPTWVHFQCVPYRSWVEGGSIFFIP